MNENNIAIKNTIFGAFFIGFLSLYELYISYSNTMFGETNHLSKEFFLFFLTLFLFSFTNFTKKLIELTSKFSFHLFSLFLIYFFISIIVSDGEIKSEYLRQLFIYMPVSFLIGFIAFSDFQWNINILNNRGSIKIWFYSLTVSYLLLSICILVGFIQTLDSRFIQIATETNIYYQDFGDAYLKSFICLIIVQFIYFKSKLRYEKSYLLLSIIIFIQTFIAAINLILIGSNKGFSLIFLTPIIFLVYAKPRNWLFKRYFLNKRVYKILAIVIVAIAFLIIIFNSIDITKTRLFDYGESGSLSENSSFTSRFDQYTRGEGQMLFQNVLFGKLSIIYLHSAFASLQTHLGLVGSFLLWSFVLIRLIHLYKRPGAILIKTITVTILLIAGISSFFTWDLLWFYFGALSTNFNNSINNKLN